MFRNKRWTAGAVLAAAAAVGVVAWAQEEDDPFYVPIQRVPVISPFELERKITFELHDWQLNEITSGRFVTFEFQMSHLHPLWTWPDGPATVVNLNQAYLPNIGGTPGFGPKKPRPGEPMDTGRAILEPPNVYVTLNALLGSSSKRLNRLMLYAKETSDPFPGYAPGAQSVSREGDLYDIDIEHCGFDVFEKITPRPWHRTNDVMDLTVPTPDDVPYPFDRGRFFGWPAEDGLSYEWAAECNTVCKVSLQYNDWISAEYQFDRSMLCEAPTLIQAHMDWLNSRIVDQQLEILNPRYQ
ncbi:hypothetical protein [Jannaschia pohangensis]|uniref:Uncharacterized protein n=1 Tax=Jannaschia pohangensis TaxID=390807 RepID=A0A1I3IGU9_9RHOB|nr:hypothetical protein [Jannaschia pohangensis]SFI47151.1 hypothetical protein SAMN04488095_0963 [Jannaschia pohangensis]